MTKDRWATLNRDIGRFIQDFQNMLDVRLEKSTMHIPFLYTQVEIAVNNLP